MKRKTQFAPNKQIKYLSLLILSSNLSFYSFLFHLTFDLVKLHCRLSMNQFSNIAIK